MSMSRCEGVCVHTSSCLPAVLGALHVGSDSHAQLQSQVCLLQSKHSNNKVTSVIQQKSNSMRILCYSYGENVNLLLLISVQ